MTGFVLSCKTLPQTNSVNPLDLLDNKSSFYIAIPKNVDQKLVERVIQNNIAGISDNEAKLISSSLDKLYIGLNRTKEGTQIQSAIKGTFPSTITSLLNRRFNVENYAVDDNKYKIYSNNEVEFSIPSGEILCLGRDVKDMINSYDDLTSGDYSVDNSTNLDSNLYSYLENSTEEIRFFADKPQSFLTILTGARLDLKLINVSGSFVCDEKNEGQYLLSVDFLFKNDKYLRAGKSLLILAFGLTDSQSEIINSNELIIKDIKINKEQLYKLLVI